MSADPKTEVSGMSVIEHPDRSNRVRVLMDEIARLTETTEAQSRAIEALRQAGADKRRRLEGAVEDARIHKAAYEAMREENAILRRQLLAHGLTPGGQ